MVHNRVCTAVYNDGASFTDILKTVRDRVHKGHRLLTHPLSGSLKPGQTPYKSVVISAVRGETTDYQSLSLIEDAIAMCIAMETAAIGNFSFLETWSEDILLDFQLIDFDLLEDVF